MLEKVNGRILLQGFKFVCEVAYILKIDCNKLEMHTVNLVNKQQNIVKQRSIACKPIVELK